MKRLVLMSTLMIAGFETSHAIKHATNEELIAIRDQRALAVDRDINVRDAERDLRTARSAGAGGATIRQLELAVQK